MFRRLTAGLLGVAALALAGLPGSAADEKKKDAPKKERIAVNEPEKLKADPDFAVQGEYEGEKVGAQVVARGGGEFDVRVLAGGLPGAGWDGKTQTKATARRGEDGVAAISGPNTSGAIVGGKLTVKSGLAPEITLTKVERKSKTLGEKPPAGAVVLFEKPGDETNWNGGKLVELSDGKYLNVGVTSKQKFGAFKAHVEFRLPWMPNSTGQGRGNSGVYLQDRYECQVLDSFGLSGENNECGGIYTQHKPKVNMCLPPMVWQTYDIEFAPAQFDGEGKKTKNGRATILHNGVKIHDDVEFPKECPGGQKEATTPGPFQLQNHGDPVVYRNIWVVEAK